MTNFLYIASGLADTLVQTLNIAFLTTICSIFRSKPDIRHLALQSNFTPLKMPNSKFESISSKDVRGVRFKAKIYVS